MRVSFLTLAIFLSLSGHAEDKKHSAVANENKPVAEIVGDDLPFLFYPGVDLSPSDGIQAASSLLKNAAELKARNLPQAANQTAVYGHMAALATTIAPVGQSKKRLETRYVLLRNRVEKALRDWEKGENYLKAHGVDDAKYEAVKDMLRKAAKEMRASREGKGDLANLMLADANPSASPIVVNQTKLGPGISPQSLVDQKPQFANAANNQDQAVAKLLAQYDAGIEGLRSYLDRIDEKIDPYLANRRDQSLAKLKELNRSLDERSNQAVANYVIGKAKKLFNESLATSGSGTKRDESQRGQ